jgi:hypothetical protein
MTAPTYQRLDSSLGIEFWVTANADSVFFFPTCIFCLTPIRYVLSLIRGLYSHVRFISYSQDVCVCTNLLLVDKAQWTT